MIRLKIISQHPEAHLLQTGAWGELKSAFGWEPAFIMSAGCDLGAQVLVSSNLGCYLLTSHGSVYPGLDDCSDRGRDTANSQGALVIAGNRRRCCISCGDAGDEEEKE